jgi:hypothetical protein
MPATGEPASLPVVPSNDAHAGLPAIEKLSGCPSGSEAVGVKS